LILNRELMIKVATGEGRIDEVDDYYRARHLRAKEVAASIGLRYENSHDDLWDWYHYYKEHLPTYQERRAYVRGLFAPTIDAASKMHAKLPPAREPTGWRRVDRALAKARGRMVAAANEEDFQEVGLLCREVLISVGQAVYDPHVHQSVDGVTPSLTDAKRMLEAFLHSVVPGDGFKEVRAHARASYDLSVNLQHRRTATRQLASLCLEATSSTVEVFAILAEADRSRSAET